MLSSLKLSILAALVACPTALGAAIGSRHSDIASLAPVDESLAVATPSQDTSFYATLEGVDTTSKSLGTISTGTGGFDWSSILSSFGGGSTGISSGLGGLSGLGGSTGTGSTVGLGDFGGFGGSSSGLGGFGGLSGSSSTGGLCGFGGFGALTGSTGSIGPSGGSTSTGATAPASTSSTPTGSTDLGDCAPLYHYHAAGTSESGLGIVGSATVAAGATTASNAITSMASKCPNSKFSVSGYSKGAMVVHGIQLSAAVQARVIGAAVFEDPDISQGSRGIPVNNEACFFSYCNAGDPVCQNGGDMTAHLAYVSNGSVDKAATGLAGCFAS